MGLEFTELKVITQETFQQITKSEKSKDIGGGQSSLALGRDSYEKVEGSGIFGSNVGADKIRSNDGQLSRPKQPGGNG